MHPPESLPRNIGKSDLARHIEPQEKRHGKPYPCAETILHGRKVREASSQQGVCGNAGFRAGNGGKFPYWEASAFAIGQYPAFFTIAPLSEGPST